MKSINNSSPRGRNSFPVHHSFSNGGNDVGRLRIINKITLLFHLLTVFTFSLNGDSNKLPIVYDPDYNITLLGMEKLLHSFDTQKYGKVVSEIGSYLINPYNIKTSHAIINAIIKDDYENKKIDFHKILYTPQIVSDDDLLTVHTQDYLDSLSSSKKVARITEIQIYGIYPLAFLPNFILQRNLLTPIKLATGGTILGAELALKYGWSINLSGGYHHAKAEKGGGFCFFADIPIAVYKILKKQPDDFKVLVIDLDAHQGNGHEAIFKDNPQIKIFDMYAHGKISPTRNFYPHDLEAKKYIDFDHPLKLGTKTKKYLKILKEELPKAIEKTKPNLIIYNAGTDIFEEDLLGGLRVSVEGIIERDEFVFKQATENDIPILMLLSGGYSPQSAGIISNSIKNLFEKDIIFAVNALEIEC